MYYEEIALETVVVDHLAFLLTLYVNVHLQ